MLSEIHGHAVGSERIEVGASGQRALVGGGGGGGSWKGATILLRKLCFLVEPLWAPESKVSDASCFVTI